MWVWGPRRGGRDRELFVPLKLEPAAHLEARWDGKRFAVWKTLLDAWLLNESWIPIGALMERSGVSYPTASVATRRLLRDGELERATSGAVRFKQLPRKSLQEILVLAPHLRGTRYFKDATGRPPDPQFLLERVKRKGIAGIRIGGVEGARFWNPDFDLHGTPRVDLLIVGSLAAAYEFRVQLPRRAVNTRDADLIVHPAGALAQASAIAERLLEVGFTPIDRCRPNATPLEAVRLRPPKEPEYFVELRGFPERNQTENKLWTPFTVNAGQYALPVFRFMGFTVINPRQSENGITYAAPEMIHQLLRRQHQRDALPRRRSRGRESAARPPNHPSCCRTHLRDRAEPAAPPGNGNSTAAPTPARE